jgi:hypothetical protein
MSNISMRKKEKKVSKKIGTFDFSMFDSRRLTDKICQKTNTSSLIRIVLMTAAGMSCPGAYKGTGIHSIWWTIVFSMEYSVLGLHSELSLPGVELCV